MSAFPSFHYQGNFSKVQSNPQVQCVLACDGSDDMNACITACGFDGSRIANAKTAWAADQAAFQNAQAQWQQRKATAQQSWDAFEQKYPVASASLEANAAQRRENRAAMHATRQANRAGAWSNARSEFKEAVKNEIDQYRTCMSDCAQSCKLNM